jgi:hypothetical protein
MDAGSADSPYVSGSERAVLEMLCNVSIEQFVEEAKQVMEGMYSLSHGKPQQLLEHAQKLK